MDEELGLLVVADGVSGHAGAEVASKIAVDVTRNSMADPDVTWPEGGLDDIEDACLRVLAAFERANRRVREQAARVEHLEGMATTLVTALVLPEAGGLVVTR